MQDAERARVFIVLRDSKIDGVKGKNRPILLLPGDNPGISRKNIDIDKIKQLDIVLYDPNNPSKNMEFSFGEEKLNSGELVFEFDGKAFSFSIDGNTLAISAPMDPNSSADKAEDVNLKIQKKLNLPFQCKNHTEPHYYTDPDKVRADCCFTEGCG